MPQAAPHALVPSGSAGGYSAVGCSGHPNALGSQFASSASAGQPLQPPQPQTSTSRGMNPAETPFAYLQSQMRGALPDLAGHAGHRQMGACVHPVSPFGPPTFKGGYTGAAATQRPVQASVLNPTNMAPIGVPEPGAENWWRIAQTPQLQETAASSLHCFGDPRVAAHGEPRVPHSASRITWDL
eukprot:s3066_g3.t1